MPVSIEISRADPQPLAEALNEAGVDFDLVERRNFDGFFTVATFVVNMIGTLGAVAVPIVLRYIDRNREKGRITINGITVEGLSPKQVEELMRDLGGNH